MPQNKYYVELERNYKWNSIMNTLDATFFQIGFVCFVPAVIIVAYLKHYTDNELILNLPVFIMNFTMTIGPLIMSFYSGRIKSKKRMVVITSFGQRILWLPVILVVYFLSGSKDWIIPAFLGMYTIFYMVWGTNLIFWQELMGRAFPPNRLSSAMGIRESISRFVGFLASLGVMYVMGRVAFPNNFLILFITCFISWFISLYWVKQIREAEYEETVDENPSGHLRNLLMLPVNNISFRWFLVFIFFLYSFLFVGGLYTVVGIERFKSQINPDRVTGMVNIITTLSSCFFAYVAGKITQRAGKFWGFFVFVIVNILLPVFITFCTNYYLYLGLILFSGVINTVWIPEFTTLIGFSAPERRHEYLAVTAFVKLFPIIIFTNLGGYMAHVFSYGAAFLTSSFLSLIALIILIFKLRPLWRDEVNADI